MTKEVKKVEENVNPATQVGNYAIVTECNGQRRIFTVLNGTVAIVPLDAISGSFELK